MTDLLSEAPAGLRARDRFFDLVLEQLKAHSLLIFVCIVSFVLAYLINIAVDREMGLSAWAYLEPILTIILPISFGLSLIGVTGYLLLVKKPASPTKALINIYYPILSDPRRWAKTIPAICIMMLGFMAFTELKPVIPDLNSYSWDVQFMELDRVLHFGQDPWQLLQPFFGHAVPTLAINFLYNLWFFIMFGFWFASGTTATDNGWERQFLLSFMLCWMIGGVFLAVIFSSMGPAFYDIIDPANNPYAAQMAWLSDIDQNNKVYALEMQDMLRESFLHPERNGIEGISAMPSMHNATSVIFMMAAFKINRFFGWVMAAFLAVIMIGSVHLAWHYAVDAYFGVFLGLVFWWMANYLTDLQDKFLAPT